MLSQTIQDLEVILLDDCSTDNSRIEIERYRGLDRVRIINNAENSGNVFRQWNKGIRLATGEYIWIAESDDFADPKFLEVLLGLLDANPQVGLAYCRSWLVGEDGQGCQDSLEYTRKLDAERWLKDYVALGREECGHYLIQKNIIPNASAVLIRRDALNRVFPVDESFRVCGDWMAWARILALSGIAYSATKLNYYRHHRNSVRASTSKALSVMESLRVQAFILRKVRVPRKVAREIRSEAARRVKGALLNTYPGLSFALKLRIVGLALRINPMLFLAVLPRNRGGERSQ